MSSVPKSEVRELRPSVIIAEALVDRHGPTEIVDRARELGFSHNLTEAVVAACCRSSRSSKSPAQTTVLRPASPTISS